MLLLKKSIVTSNFRVIEKDKKKVSEYSSFYLIFKTKVMKSVDFQSTRWLIFTKDIKKAMGKFWFNRYYQDNDSSGSRIKELLSLQAIENVTIKQYNWFAILIDSWITIAYVISVDEPMNQPNCQTATYKVVR